MELYHDRRAVIISTFSAVGLPLPIGDSYDNTRLPFKTIAMEIYKGDRRKKIRKSVELYHRWQGESRRRTLRAKLIHLQGPRMIMPIPDVN